MGNLKGTHDAWNMCISQCIVNSWLFGAKLVMRDNSVRYETINNEHKLRDVV